MIHTQEAISNREYTVDDSVKLRFEVCVPTQRLRRAFNQEETAWIVEEMSEKGVGEG